MTPDELPENASFGVLDEMIPEKIYVSEEEWNKLNEALNEPPKVSEALKRLFKDDEK